ncbi:MAG: hypothetical protein AAB804_01420 [Patescibacteria group bacterium]
MIARMIVVTWFLWGIPFAVGAATFVSEPLSDQVGVGQLAAFTLFLDTQGKAINALDGAVLYDEKKFEFKGVVDGGSIISAWLRKLGTEGPGQLLFSGIIPDGYEGGRGKLFTLYFIARDVGDGAIVMRSDAYLNDGDGTRIVTDSLSSSVTIVQGRVAGALSEVPTADIEAPHSIKAVVAQNKAMFGGRPFIILDAKDSQSGILRYELLQSETELSFEALETRSFAWRTISNPEALSSPIGKYLYVRAIDKVGNATVAVVSREGQLSPEKSAEPFSAVGSFGILMAVAAMLFLFYRLTKSPHV